jgi:hypothetical protein
LWVGVSGELPLTTPTGRCQLYATANTNLYHSCCQDDRCLTLTKPVSEHQLTEADDNNNYYYYNNFVILYI